MKFALQTSVISIVAMLAATQALAETGVPSLPTPGGFSLTPSVGTDFTVGGEFVKSGSQSVSGSGTAFGVTVSGTGTLSVEKQRFNDVYNTPVQVGVAGNYGLTTHDEVSLGLRWLHASGKTFDAGTVDFSGTINGVAVSGGAPFQAEFSNYNEYGVDGGYKHFFDTTSASFHPYLGAMLGLVHTNEIKVDLSASGTAVVNDVHFYGSGWTWESGIQTGFRYDVAPAVAVGVETGIRYVGDLKRNNTDLAGTGGLADVNDGGSRWDIPVMFGLTAKF